MHNNRRNDYYFVQAIKPPTLLAVEVRLCFLGAHHDSQRSQKYHPAQEKPQESGCCPGGDTSRTAEAISLSPLSTADALRKPPLWLAWIKQPCCREEAARTISIREQSASADGERKASDIYCGSPPPVFHVATRGTCHRPAVQVGHQPKHSYQSNTPHATQDALLARSFRERASQLSITKFGLFIVSPSPRARTHKHTPNSRRCVTCTHTDHSLLVLSLLTIDDSPLF
jgi:hypothetical protein